jgi:hypothetical protein
MAKTRCNHIYFFARFLHFMCVTRRTCVEGGRLWDSGDVTEATSDWLGLKGSASTTGPQLS